MIKFLTRGKDKRTVLGLGITDMNIKMLQQGRPVHVKGEDVQMDRLDIMIFHGKTEADLLKQMKQAGIELPKGTYQS
jgi:oligoribonuclease (3'-5' exoribonuclease)